MRNDAHGMTGSGAAYAETDAHLFSRERPGEGGFGSKLLSKDVAWRALREVSAVLTAAVASVAASAAPPAPLATAAVAVGVGFVAVALVAAEAHGAATARPATCGDGLPY